jgi:hypothetical protein
MDCLDQATLLSMITKFQLVEKQVKLSREETYMLVISHHKMKLVLCFIACNEFLGQEFRFILLVLPA